MSPSVSLMLPARLTDLALVTGKQ